MSSSFTETEQLLSTTARIVEEDELYYVTAGGTPYMTMLMAMRSHAPNTCFMLENGTIGPRPSLPIGTFQQCVNSRADYRSAMWADMNTVNFIASTGYIGYAMLNALQIDQRGNFNSVILGGDYYHPHRRFGGIGGANEIASLCWRTILQCEQTKRKFVKQLDFVAAPGYIDGSAEAKANSGLPKGTVPYRVVTPMAVFGYDEETRWMKLLAVSTWVTVDEVLSNMDFEPMLPDKVQIIEPPTEEELHILRSEVDPSGQTIGKGKWINL